mmetsp:Transcript_4242/g.9114  ORF Transcript_4242/g.9114 Transcript_4242/m.9114 type:complete len:100 (+) Transcript_4242:550-849(+)
MILSATSSVRGALSLLAAVAVALCTRVTAPDLLSHMRWRSSAAPPPPRCFQPHGFLTPEKAKAQSKRATEGALKDLVASPEFQQWMLRNHHRVDTSKMD